MRPRLRGGVRHRSHRPAQRSLHRRRDLPCRTEVTRGSSDWSHHAVLEHDSSPRRTYRNLWITAPDNRRSMLPMGRIAVAPWPTTRRAVAAARLYGYEAVIGDRWGVTPAERQRRFPCDELIPDPGFQAWRGVTVEASCSDVWPWVAQIRLAPYSYDWIDNLGRRSPQRLRGLPDPVIGERFTTAFGGRPAGRVIATTAGEHLTGEIMGAVMSYVLVPYGTKTRLLLKLVTRERRAFTPLLSLGDLIMARRQLLNIARLAEQGAGNVRPPALAP